MCSHRLEGNDLKSMFQVRRLPGMVVVRYQWHPAGIGHLRQHGDGDFEGGDRHPVTTCRCAQRLPPPTLSLAAARGPGGTPAKGPLGGRTRVCCSGGPGLRRRHTGHSRAQCWPPNGGCASPAKSSMCTSPHHSWRGQTTPPLCCCWERPSPGATQFKQLRGEGGYGSAEGVERARLWRQECRGLVACFCACRISQPLRSAPVRRQGSRRCQRSSIVSASPSSRGQRYDVWRPKCCWQRGSAPHGLRAWGLGPAFPCRLE